MSKTRDEVRRQPPRRQVARPAEFQGLSWFLQLAPLSAEVRAQHDALARCLGVVPLEDGDLVQSSSAATETGRCA